MTLENRNDELEARLSAYAFGELEGEERAELERALAADPTLVRRVAELRAFGGELRAALAEEAPAAAQSVPSAPSAPAPTAESRAGGRLLRFPAWAWSAAGFAAAAGVAVMVATREPAFRAAEEPARPLAPDTPLARPTAATEPTEPTQAQAAPLPGGSIDLAVKDKAEVVFRADFAPPPPADTDHFSGRIEAPAVALAPPSPPPVAVLAPPAPPPPAATLPPPAVAGHVVKEVSRTWQRPAGFTAGFVAVRDAEVPVFEREPVSGEHYVGVRESRFVAAAAEPLSTFSIDVDTASYSNVRRFLQSGRLPPRDAVRVEELINYFPYRYAPPPPPVGAARAADAPPFAAHLAVASAPWAPRHRLVRVALKGRELTAEARPAANLVFLVDVSGSMSSDNKLPLVKSSLRQLLGQLGPEDRVALVTYAGASGLALPSTPVERSGEILAALERLESGGSTNGGMGIHLAYDIAKANFVPGGVNRVILCTDGDFNVGVTGRDELLALIREKARSRVFLSVLGFGMGNLKDGTLELLANKGNGVYAYIDGEREARKVFVEQAQGTLATIAKDVKIQVEFNPARVASYRLIGYENRALVKEDFNNDRVDAGEIGAGHTVTALYEIVPVGAAHFPEEEPARPEVDPLKYGRPAEPAPAAVVRPAHVDGTAELLTVKIRYKSPEGDVSRKLEFPLVDRGLGFAAADGEFQFAAAVAAWGMLLRESAHGGDAGFMDVLAWAEAGLANDPRGHRAEFVELVRRSARLAPESRE